MRTAIQRPTIEDFQAQHPTWALVEASEEERETADWITCPECDRRGLEAKRLEPAAGDDGLDLVECPDCKSTWRTN